jgi:putative transposon-encoded protein
MNASETHRNLEGPGKANKAKISFFGEEMLEKEVRPRGNTGRVYLPPDWVGKTVKIIRID